MAGADATSKVGLQFEAEGLDPIIARVDTLRNSVDQLLSAASGSLLKGGNGAVVPTSSSSPHSVFFSSGSTCWAFQYTNIGSDQWSAVTPTPGVPFNGQAYSNGPQPGVPGTPGTPPSTPFSLNTQTITINSQTVTLNATTVNVGGGSGGSGGSGGNGGSGGSGGGQPNQPAPPPSPSKLPPDVQKLKDELTKIGSFLGLVNLLGSATQSFTGLAYGSDLPQDAIYKTLGSVPLIGGAFQAALGYNYEASVAGTRTVNNMVGYGIPASPGFSSDFSGFSPTTMKYIQGQSGGGYGVASSTVDALEAYKKAPDIQSAIAAGIGTMQGTPENMAYNGLKPLGPSDAFSLAFDRGDMATALKLLPGLNNPSNTAIFRRQIEQNMARLGQDDITASVSTSEVGRLLTSSSVSGAFGRYGEQSEFIGAADTQRRSTLLPALQDKLRYYSDRMAREKKNGNVAGFQAANLQYQDVASQIAGIQAESSQVPLQQANLAYQGSSVTAQATKGVAEAGLGAQGSRGVLFNSSTSSLFATIQEGIAEQIRATSKLIADETKAGAGDGLIKPLRTELANLKAEVGKVALQEFEQTYRDMATPYQARVSVASSRLSVYNTEGRLADAGMAHDMNGRISGLSGILTTSRSKYTTALKKYGANSQVTLDARSQMESDEATLAGAAFSTNAELSGNFGRYFSSVGQVSSGQANLTTQGGGGSVAALTYNERTATALQGNTSSAQLQYYMDKHTPGAGQTLLNEDRGRVEAAQVASGNQVLSLGNFQETASYDVTQLGLNNKLTRLTSSWSEPGNVFDVRKGLLDQARTGMTDLKKQETQVDTYLKANPQYEYLRPQLTKQFYGQEQGFRMQAFEQQQQMDQGWIDRLVSTTYNAPSFLGRMKPTLSEAATELDRQGMQYRGFGFVSDRGAKAERDRGVMTTGGSDTTFYPGMMSTMALSGMTKLSSPLDDSTAIKFGVASPPSKKSAPDAYDGDIFAHLSSLVGGGSKDDRLIQVMTDINHGIQSLVLLAKGTGGAGLTPKGTNGIAAASQSRAMRDVGDVGHGQPGGFTLP